VRSVLRLGGEKNKPKRGLARRYDDSHLTSVLPSIPEPTNGSR
jgi:hypothetical protein